MVHSHLELFYHLEISFGGCIGNGQGMTGTGNQVCANWAWGRPSIFKFEGMSGNITESIGYRAHERTKPMRIVYAHGFDFECTMACAWLIANPASRANKYCAELRLIQPNRSGNSLSNYHPCSRKH